MRFFTRTPHCTGFGFVIGSGTHIFTVCHQELQIGVTYNKSWFLADTFGVKCTEPESKIQISKSFFLTIILFKIYIFLYWIFRQKQLHFSKNSSSSPECNKQSGFLHINVYEDYCLTFTPQKLFCLRNVISRFIKSNYLRNVSYSSVDCFYKFSTNKYLLFLRSDSTRICYIQAGNSVLSDAAICWSLLKLLLLFVDAMRYVC